MSYSKQEIEELGLDDFRVFLIEVWAYLSRLGAIQGKGPFGSVVRPTPVQLDIAYWLQHSERRVILQAFRGVGKSWITVAFVLWILFLDPNKKIMVVSANEKSAAQFTKFCKQLIEGMPLLQHLKTRPGQSDSTELFDVGPAAPSKDPSVKSVGITGQLTGSRADLIVPDDVEVPKNVRTPLLRDWLAGAVTEFDAVLKPDGRVVYLGTPQVEESLYVKLAKDRGYVTRIWPVEIPENPDVYHGRLAPYVLDLIAKGAQPHDPIDPKRFDREDIAGRRLSYGSSGFALQFMLDTSLQSAEKHPLKLHDLLITDIDSDVAPVKMVWGNDRELCLRDLTAEGFDGDHYYCPAWKSTEMSPYSGTVMWIDPSGKGNDETGYAIVKLLHSQLYLVAVGGFRSGFAEETLEALATKALRHKVNWIVVESNFGNGMFDQLLKPWLQKKWDALPPALQAVTPRASIDEEFDSWSTGQKELRILDTLEPIVQSHRLIVDRRVIEDDLTIADEERKYSFVYQFTRMCRQKAALAHEDRLEAVAGACQYFADRMSQDRDQAVENHKQDALDQEVRDFIEYATGQQQDDYRWN